MRWGVFLAGAAAGGALTAAAGAAMLAGDASTEVAQTTSEEGREHAAPQPEPAAPEPWTKESFAAAVAGKSKAEVRALLGPPGIVTTAGGEDIWYYSSNRIDVYDVDAGVKVDVDVRFPLGGEAYASF